MKLPCSRRGFSSFFFTCTWYVNNRQKSEMGIRCQNTLSCTAVQQPFSANSTVADNNSEKQTTTQNIQILKKWDEKYKQV